MPYHPFFCSVELAIAGIKKVPRNWRTSYFDLGYVLAFAFVTTTAAAAVPAAAV